MNKNQEEKINELLTKYNDILLVSMRLAISEDLIDLIILNKEDTDFELSNLLKNKNDFSNYIMREFLKNNSSSVLKDLRNMEEPLLELKRKIRR